MCLLLWTTLEISCSGVDIYISMTLEESHLVKVGLSVPSHVGGKESFCSIPFV